jgi:hypothetical protein
MPRRIVGKFRAISNNYFEHSTDFAPDARHSPPERADVLAIRRAKRYNGLGFQGEQ